MNCDDLSYFDSLESSKEPSYVDSSSTNDKTVDEAKANINLIDELDPLTNTGEVIDLHIETSSSSESESDNGGKMVRDDTMDFDDIMCRPAADSNISASKMSSEVWAGTDDSGIGVEFKATFSVSIYWATAHY